MLRRVLARPLFLAGLMSAALVIWVTTTALAATPVPNASPSPAAPTAPPPPPPSSPSPSPSCVTTGRTTTCTAAATNPISAVGSAISGAPGAVVGSITDDATQSFTTWVASGAAYVLDQSAGWLQAATPPSLNSTWWAQHYAAMRRLAVVLMFPFLMAAVISALVRRNPMMMVQAFLIRMPLAFVLTGAAVLLTSAALTASDEMTTIVTGPATSSDTFAFMHNLATSFTGSTAGGNPTPLFIVAIASVLTVIAGLVMFLELLLRSGVIYIALLFMPLALAASVWPGAQRWAKRLAETLVAAILSKFVIISVISLAAGALAVDTTAAQGAGGGGSGGGIGTLLTGVILLGLAAFAPYKLFRMLPGMESAAIGHMEGMRQRGVSGARAAVAAPRDGLERLSRQRATERSAFSGKAIGGVTGAATTGAAMVGGLAVAGSARAGMAFAGNGAKGDAPASDRTPASGAGASPAGSSPAQPATPPPPAHSPPSASDPGRTPAGSPRG